MKPEQVVLVGRGRMAAAFASALRARGIAFARVSGRALTDRAALRGLARQGRAVWLLAVTDAAVGAVTEALVARALVRRGDVVAHMAGMLGPDVLAPAVAAGAAVAAMHPLVAVASPSRPPSLERASIAIEPWPAHALAWRRLAALVRSLGAVPERIVRTERTRYHAAAALVATGAVALAQGAAAMFALSAPASDARTHRRFVASLLRSVAHNVEAVGPERALASPLMRGDTSAVARHLEALAVRPGARALYRAALGQALDTLARERAIAPAVIRTARALLTPDESTPWKTTPKTPLASRPRATSPTSATRSAERSRAAPSSSSRRATRSSS